MNQPGKAVDFRLHVPGARSVGVAGSFNRWQPQAMNHGADDIWRVSLHVPAGSYEYKFIIDGHWMEDPGNPQKVPNSHGSHNSIRLVL